jgi:hypothetical protein
VAFATFRPLPTTNVLWPTALHRAILHQVHAESNEKARSSMFGLVMVFTLIFMTVATPFAVMAKAKAKSRRK